MQRDVTTRRGRRDAGGLRGLTWDTAGDLGPSRHPHDEERHDPSSATWPYPAAAETAHRRDQLRTDAAAAHFADHDERAWALPKGCR
jgi:hypothetical protein